ncbi:hypothetical protein LEP1GSC150_5008 [Leptospira interrogans serovar Copenhageni str. LT2050]|uniref:SIS domain protein n=1 Tax=Leptospira interrogans serovar Copenhageni str. LT2050 TaxID=1001598 RepID=M3I1W9_LEPIT|nr:hypothetical protein LEP1GSC150_5008 [Leptospira interrogans serovar Copenhageni str. LT2050]
MDPIFEKIEKAIDTEIESILYFRKNLDPSIKQAIELILECKGKLIVTGVGKSGDVGKKFLLLYLPQEHLLFFYIPQTQPTETPESFRVKTLS